MIFDLTIQAENDNLKFYEDSALVKFFNDGENLSKLVDDFFASFNFPQNILQRKNFIEDKNTTEILYHSPFGEPSLIFLKKIKIDKSFNSDFFRNYFAGLISQLQNRNIKNLHIVVPAFAPFPTHFESDDYLIQTIIEGIHLGNYSFDKYLSKNKSISKLKVLIHFTDKNKLKKLIDKTNILMNSVFFARDLVNEPAINLTPQEFAKRTKENLKLNDVKVTILNKSELQKRKMNAILAVGNASKNEPLMMYIHYKPKYSNKKIALVGKGVTYDSGGLSLKPTSGMIEMKADMAGGALVVATIQAAAKLNLPVELIGVIPCVENMVSGSSYKPGDVIIASNGKSIEVKDTDAEGRIILADALHFVSQQKPDEIIDFATLTGAIVVALGEFIAGLFTKNDDMAKKIFNSAQKTFERIWRMPFYDDYKTMLKSDIADVANLGSRWGGAITAAKFLEYFVDEKIPWTHIDIAGPAIKHDFNNYTKKWDTGFGVRLMIDYLSN
ncbi:MAG: leucyl aminopeptidase [Stygiobacter sp.]